MYERFTDRSRKVMQLANQAAVSLNHEYVGTEHILIGLLGEGSGVGANVLKNLGLDLNEVRLEVDKIVQAGPDVVTMGKLPQTPRAKKVLEYAIEDARTLKHNYVGTEHLLLGLLREKDGIAVQVLTNFGVSLDAVREEVMILLGIPSEETTRTALGDNERTARHERLVWSGVATPNKESRKLEEIKKIVELATDPMAALQAIKNLLNRE